MTAATEPKVPEEPQRDVHWCSTSAEWVKYADALRAALEQAQEHIILIELARDSWKKISDTFKADCLKAEQRADRLQAELDAAVANEREACATLDINKMNIIASDAPHIVVKKYIAAIRARKP